MPGPTFAELFARGAGEANYNEIVLDAGSWASQMPHAVEAIVDDQQAHEAFVKRYALDPDTFPLVQLDLHDFDRPFKLSRTQ